LVKSNSNFRILVVDDEAMNRELAGIYLKEEGYIPVYAQDAQEAVAAVKKEQISLILLDINMPKVDGFTACKIFKSNPKTKDIPVIFLTAQTDVKYIAKAFEVGGSDYISKPFNALELKVRVRTHLKQLIYLEEIKHKQAKFAQLSITDSFTKLSNAFYFDARVKQLQKEQEAFWFVYIKINRFEKINALYGYYGANKIIRMFAKILQQSAPQNSVVAKLHGVSFSILLKDYNLQVMKDIYTTVAKNISQNHELAQALRFCMVFQRVAEKQRSLEELYKRAQTGVEDLQERGEAYLFL